MLIQFILSLILLLALVMTWRRAKQQVIRRIEALGWTLVWLVAGVVIWRPEAASFAARLVGVGRGADLVLYAAVIALLLLVFQLHIAHDKLEKKLTELVRREALEALSANSNVKEQMSNQCLNDSSTNKTFEI